MYHPLWQLMQIKHYSYPCHVITLPDTLRRVKSFFIGQHSRKLSCRNFPEFQVVMQDGVHRSNEYVGIGKYLFHSQAAVFHNHLFHSCIHVFRSPSAWPRPLRFVCTRRSAFFQLSSQRTYIFHFHNAIIACLTQLMVNFDVFHATQMEEWDNHALFLEYIRRKFSVSKTPLLLDDVTRIQRVGQCCHFSSPNLKNSHVISNKIRVSTCFHSREKEIKGLEFTT